MAGGLYYWVRVVVGTGLELGGMDIWEGNICVDTKETIKAIKKAFKATYPNINLIISKSSIL